MYRLSVLYGHPADPGAFDDYYWNHHLEVARRRRGIRRWSVTMLEPGPQGEPPPYHCVADMDLRSRADLIAMMASEAGQASRRDVARFATGGVTFCHGPTRLITDVERGLL